MGNFQSREPWNKCKLVGQKPPLKTQQSDLIATWKAGTIVPGKKFSLPSSILRVARGSVNHSSPVRNCATP